MYRNNSVKFWGLIALLLIFTELTGCTSQNRKGITSIVSAENIAYRSKKEAVYFYAGINIAYDYPIIEVLRKAQFFSSVTRASYPDIREQGYTVHVYAHEEDQKIKGSEAAWMVFAQLFTASIIPWQERTNYRFDVKIFHNGKSVSHSQYKEVVDTYTSLFGPWAYLYGHDMKDDVTMAEYIRKDIAVMLVTQILHKISPKI